jgi:hypothetical protein
VFELWLLENRLFPACRTFPEEIEENLILLYHTIPRTNTSERSRISQLFQKKAIQPRICVVKMEIDQGQKNIVSIKLLCSKDANYVAQIRSFV